MLNHPSCVARTDWNKAYCQGKNDRPRIAHCCGLWPYAEQEIYMKEEMVKVNQGVVQFLLNQNWTDGLYAST